LRHNNNPGAEAGGKAWIQFDLSSIRATHGKENLVSATLSIWNGSGTSRKFDVSGLADNSGLEGWTSAELTWDNAPGNDITSSYAFIPSALYNGETQWKARDGGIDVSTLEGEFHNAAKYISPDISAFLMTDTDGKVTFMLGSEIWDNNSQSVWIRVDGTYPADHPNVRLPHSHSGVRDRAGTGDRGIVPARTWSPLLQADASREGLKLLNRPPALQPDGHVQHEVVPILEAAVEHRLAAFGQVILVHRAEALEVA
jgi:hypothetical protein